MGDGDTLSSFPNFLRTKKPLEEWYMKKKKISYARFGYIFSIPFVVTFALFTLYPIIYTVLIGFTDFKGLGATTFNFLDDPLQNYKTILE